MVAIVFLTSGWEHLRDPVGRSKDIVMSKGFPIFLGAAECAGALGLIFGIWTELAAIGLILVMLGADKKIFVWHTGFWGYERNEWLKSRHDVGDYESCHSHDGRRPFGVMK